VRFALAALLLVACGGRIDAPAQTGDASTTNAAVPCGDAGACAASTSFCHILYADGGLAYECASFPNACHTCSCAAPPKVGQICSCTSDGPAILVSCTAQ
jgi:hypothetical protein